MAYGLMVSPDFSDVEAGLAHPPRVNHSEVNFLELARTLEELFPFGPQLAIRVANDTIDQVTIHQRLGVVSLPKTSGGCKSNDGSVRCEDFGQALVKCAAKQKNGVVIDVRAAWFDLHYLQNRDEAPPPAMIPFIVEAADFEDAVIWGQSARSSLGMAFLPPLLQKLTGDHQEEKEGSLSVEFRERLGRLFRCKFEEFALIGQIASDKPPAAYVFCD